MNKTFVFAVGHVSSSSFGGFNAEGWDYIKAKSAEAAWYAAKKKWDYVFPLADFQAALARATCRQYPFPEGAPSRNGKFVEAKIW